MADPTPLEQKAADRALRQKKIDDIKAAQREARAAIKADTDKKKAALAAERIRIAAEKKLAQKEARAEAAAKKLANKPLIHFYWPEPY